MKFRTEFEHGVTAAGARRDPLFAVVAGSIIVNVGSLVMFAFPGAGAIPSGAEASAYVCAVLALVGAYGVAKHKRWGWWTTLVITAFNVLTSVPGLAAWPSLSIGIGIVISTVIGIGVVVGLFRLDRGRIPNSGQPGQAVLNA
ncbi:MAG TPA: hypothetical protein VGO03_04000 [Acidimicrobiia bacterium]|jgi:uncharacterized membrane protein YccC